MVFYLLKVKTIQNIGGKKVPFYFTNTYTDYSKAKDDANEMGKNSNVIGMDLDEYVLYDDGTTQFVDSTNFGRIVRYSPNELQYDTEVIDTDTIAASSRKAQEILASGNKSDDLKLAEIFKLFSNYLRVTNVSLYYALLGWNDAHLTELLKEKSNINKGLKFNKDSIEKCECDNCKGLGVVTAPINSGANTIESCPICLGKGQVIKIKDMEDK